MRLRGQVLIYPVNDAALPIKPSYVVYGSGYSLTWDDMIRFWHDYIGGDSSGTDNLEIYPLRAQDLRGRRTHW